MITKYIDFINEATFERDAKFYDEAEKFYEDLEKSIENKEYKGQDDGNFILKGTKINPKYYDLLILFIPNNAEQDGAPSDVKVGYGIGKWNGYIVITINNLKEPNDDSKIGNLWKSSIIHEFIHYLDRKRYKNFDYKTKNDTASEYFNNPAEFNAYYQEFSTRLFKDVFVGDMLPLFKEKFKNYNDFKDYVIQVYDKDWIKHLNDTNKKKLDKRLYNQYVEFLKRVENLES